MMKHAWTGVVLAGGRSSRMGRDKALMELGGRTLLQRTLDLLEPHVDELLVIGDPDKYGPLPVPIVPDDEPGWGPLGGIVTALRRASHDRSIVLACDMPALTRRFIERLQMEMSTAADALVPEHGGLIEPLAAAYHKRCLRPFEQRIVDGRLKMRDALDAVSTSHLSIEPGENDWPQDLFRNINSPGDL